MTVTAMPPAGAPADTAAEASAEKRSMKKLAIIAVVVLLGAGYGAWTFVLKPVPPPKEPVPGEIMTLEAIQVNLAGGHYLRLGLALQLEKEAYEVDGSRALDRAIDLFSGQRVGDLGDPDIRARLKSDLSEELHEIYHGDVLEVYFTDFVTQ